MSTDSPEAQVEPTALPDQAQPEQPDAGQQQGPGGFPPPPGGFGHGPL